MSRLRNFLLVALLKRTRWRFANYRRRYTDHPSFGLMFSYAKSPSVYDPACCAAAFLTVYIGRREFQFLKQFPIDLIPEPKTKDYPVYRR